MVLGFNYLLCCLLRRSNWRRTLVCFSISVILVSFCDLCWYGVTSGRVGCDNSYISNCVMVLICLNACFGVCGCWNRLRYRRFTWNSIHFLIGFKVAASELFSWCSNWFWNEWQLSSLSLSWGYISIRSDEIWNKFHRSFGLFFWEILVIYFHETNGGRLYGRLITSPFSFLYLGGFGRPFLLVWIEIAANWHCLIFIN